MSFLQKRRTKDRLLRASQDYVSEYFDDFGLMQLLDWKTQAYRHKDLFGEVKFDENWQIVSNVDPLPEGYEIQLTIPYIKAVEAWKDQVLADYLLNRKPLAMAGQPVDYDFTNNGEPPVSFTDIFLVVTPALRPQGWQYPQI